VLEGLCDLRTTDMSPLKELLDKGLTAVRAGNKEEANPSLEQARLLAARAGVAEAEVLIGRAVERLGQGETDRAAADLVDAMAAVRDVDNLARARRVLQEAVGLEANNVWAHKYFGDVLLRQGDRAGAIEQYLAVQALVPEEAGPYADLGEAYLRSSLYSKAEESFVAGTKKVSKEDTDTAWRLYRGLGDVCIRLRKYQQARDAYKQALDVFPFDTASLLGLGIAYYQLKDWDESLRQAELVLHLAEGNPEIQNEAKQLADLVRRMQESEQKSGKSGQG